MLTFAALKTSDAIALGAALVSLASLCVAGYAAVVGDKARRWQKTNDLMLRAANIGFEFEHKSAKRPPGGIHFGTGREPYLYWLVLSVINNGETDEQLQSVTIRTAQGAHKEYAMMINKKLSAHNRHTFWVDVSKLPESADGYIARAQLARGEPFDSNQVKEDDATREKVRTDNSAAGLGQHSA
jgi:hypothetical protein